MIRNRHLVILPIIALLLAGCHKQAPVTPAPAAHAPSIGPQPPPPIPSVATASTPATVHSGNEAPATATVTKPKTVHRPRRTKPSPIISPPPVVAENHAPEAETETVPTPAPAKPVPELQITTPAGQAGDHTRYSTEQLLDSTDHDLLNLQPKSKDEIATVQQIRSYQKDARDALKAEDLTRAHNLAVKAQLLSSSLVHAH